MRNYKLVWLNRPWNSRPGLLPYDQSIAADSSRRRYNELRIIPIDAKLDGVGYSDKTKSKEE
ncbi:MAG: hypothetical protein KAS66_03905 [Candidatus Omnitrophica bacterium]|nr:hypothetical protein [Candidatus Omnitrophota bacterium]